MKYLLPHQLRADAFATILVTNPLNKAKQNG
jgi:hypothetical protein